MQSQNPFFDDLARVASGAMGALSGLRAEMEAAMRQQFERLTSNLDFVPREEFEVVRAMAQKAREEQETLIARIAALEAKLDAAKAAPAEAKPKAAAKPRVAKPKASPAPKAGPEGKPGA